MNDRSAIDAFWEAYLATLADNARPRPQAFESWSFGNSSEMADRLLARVLEGVKTATSSLLWSYEIEGEALPAAGEYSVILDGKGVPGAVIRTDDVVVQSFRSVDENLAFDEGEGDQSLSFWRQVHWRFFAEECREIGKEPGWDMDVVCERFTRVYPAPS